MADYLADFVPDFVKDEQPREIILKLGHMVTNRIPYKLGLKKLTKYDPRNPNAHIFPISAKTGEGIEALAAWLESRVRQWKEGD